MSEAFASTLARARRALVPVLTSAALFGLADPASAAAPGITGTGTPGTFELLAQAASITQPDGAAVYSWGYGCSTPSAAGFAPTNIKGAFCGSMQIPGPTLVVVEGTTVTVKLTNRLPAAAGNTSILFPGFVVTSSGGVPGLLTREAAPGDSVTYTFTASTPGTRAYYSGTQGDLQVEMGLYGAIIVLPNSAPSAGCPQHNTAAGLTPDGTALVAGGEKDFRLSRTGAAYHLPQSCYDREYLFQFSELDPLIHSLALALVTAAGNCVPGAARCRLTVATEPYHPVYFMINGRSMPDDMDPNYAAQYPHQPYNGNPHMHPGELVLLRVIGQGRWQHPFHEHGNHVRILARDGNLILSQSDPTQLAGPLLFTTTTTPGLAMDGIFYWTGKGLNWDAYGHNPASADALAKLPCIPDPNGYNTGNLTAVNYYEWCQDHNKPVQAAPFGDVPGGGPVTLPDPNLFTNGAWYGGSPYLGPNATVRAVGPTGSTPPSGTIANSPTSEAGFAFMWHSHNEREITTNNIFPGGMLMMMLVDSREFVIDESN
jgi:FtsP/CotA-like multicopper oxidase with cupredoxin domain